MVWADAKFTTFLVVVLASLSWEVNCGSIKDHLRKAKLMQMFKDRKGLDPDQVEELLTSLNTIQDEDLHNVQPGINDAHLDLTIRVKEDEQVPEEKNEDLATKSPRLRSSASTTLLKWQTRRPNL